MSYSFGKRSLENFNTLHPDLQKILGELIMMYDFSIIEGERTLETQQKYFKEGKSKLDGINKKSKHQSSPSLAADIMPYKKGTNAFSGSELDNRRFYMMMGMVKAIADRLLIKGEISHRVRFGLDWDGDDTFKDQTFHDLPHVELI
jgi:peptidoglycan L-alanyl-D-glutamate endopeptidase CwlK